MHSKAAFQEAIPTQETTKWTFGTIGIWHYGHLSLWASVDVHSKHTKLCGFTVRIPMVAYFTDLFSS